MSSSFLHSHIKIPLWKVFQFLPAPLTKYVHFAMKSVGLFSSLNISPYDSMSALERELFKP